MNKKALLLIATVVGAVIAIVYYFLGGFNSPKLELVSVDGYKVYGQMFKGDYKDPNLRSLFFKVKGMTGPKNLNGILTVINFPEAEEESGYLENFIGVLSQKVVQLPDSFEIKQYSNSRAIRVLIDANPAVRPHPRDIRELVNDFGQENDLKLEAIFIEQYLDDRILIIDVPVK